jgi:hypothetical protein
MKSENFFQNLQNKDDVCIKIEYFKLRKKALHDTSLILFCIELYVRFSGLSHNRGKCDISLLIFKSKWKIMKFIIFNID